MENETAIEKMIQDPDWPLAYYNYPKFYQNKIKPIKIEISSLNDDWLIDRSHHFIKLSELYKNLYDLKQFQLAIYYCLTDNYFLFRQYTKNKDYDALKLIGDHTMARLKNICAQFQNKLASVITPEIDLNQIFDQFQKTRQKTICGFTKPNSKTKHVHIHLYKFDSFILYMQFFKNISIDQIEHIKIKELKTMNHQLLQEYQVMIDQLRTQLKQKNQYSPKYFHKRRYLKHQNFYPLRYWIHFNNLLYNIQNKIIHYYGENVISSNDANLIVHLDSIDDIITIYQSAYLLDKWKKEIENAQNN